jgi:hypothetical protein
MNLEVLTATYRSLRWVKHAGEIALMHEITPPSRTGCRSATGGPSGPELLVQEMDMSMAALLAEESATQQRRR